MNLATVSTQPWATKASSTECSWWTFQCPRKKDNARAWKGLPFSSWSYLPLSTLLERKKSPSQIGSTMHLLTKFSSASTSTKLSSGRRVDDVLRPQNQTCTSLHVSKNVLQFLAELGCSAGYVPQPQTSWLSWPVIKELVSEQVLHVVPHLCTVDPQGYCTLMGHLKQWCSHHHQGVDTQKTLVCRQTCALFEAQCPYVAMAFICHPKMQPAHYSVLFPALLRYSQY